MTLSTAARRLWLLNTASHAELVHSMSDMCGWKPWIPAKGEFHSGIFTCFIRYRVSWDRNKRTLSPGLIVEFLDNIMAYLYENIISKVFGNYSTSIYVKYVVHL
jgi:hypothetical protein